MGSTAARWIHASCSRRRAVVRPVCSDAKTPLPLASTATRKLAKRGRALAAASSSSTVSSVCRAAQPAPTLTFRPRHRVQRDDASTSSVGLHHKLARRSSVGPTYAQMPTSMIRKTDHIPERRSRSRRPLSPAATQGTARGCPTHGLWRRAGERARSLWIQA